MAPTGFAPVQGRRFTFQTRPAGAWDGVIHCQVLEVIPNERLAYSWWGGHATNEGYGAPLDTVVTWTLTPTPNGTRLRLSCRLVVRNAPPARPWAGWRKVVPSPRHRRRQGRPD